MASQHHNSLTTSTISQSNLSLLRFILLVLLFLGSGFGSNPTVARVSQALSILIVLFFFPDIQSLFAPQPEPSFTRANPVLVPPPIIAINSPVISPKIRSAKITLNFQALPLNRSKSCASPLLSPILSVKLTLSQPSSPTFSKKAVPIMSSRPSRPTVSSPLIHRSDERLPSQTQTHLRSSEKADSKNEKDSSVGFGLAIWPIVLAILPPTFSFFFGMDDFWSDTFLLMLVVYYMYSLIQIPWNLYQVSRQRRFANPIETAVFGGGESGAAAIEALRYEAQVRLKRQEMMAFIFVLISPLIGGWLFVLARERLQALNAFVSDFNILLFVLAAEVRPLSHLSTLLQESAQELQDTVHHPTSAVESLSRRMLQLENELTQLKKAYATKTEIGQMKETIEPNLQQLSKIVKAYQQRERSESSRFDFLIQDLKRQISEIKGTAPPSKKSASSLSNSDDSCEDFLEEMPLEGYSETTDEWIRSLPLSILKIVKYIPSRIVHICLLPITLPLSFIGSYAQTFLPGRHSRRSLLTHNHS